MTEERDASDDVHRAAKAAAVLGVVFTLGALALYDLRTAAGVLIGAAIAVANLVTMRAIIRALVDPPEAEDGAAEPSNAQHESAGRRGGVAWGIFAALKIVLLFGGIWFLLSRQLVEPMPLVVGYGVLPLGILAGSLLAMLRPRR